jgi:hypothetical protein
MPCDHTCRLERLTHPILPPSQPRNFLPPSSFILLPWIPPEPRSSLKPPPICLFSALPAAWLATGARLSKAKSCGWVLCARQPASERPATSSAARPAATSALGHWALSVGHWILLPQAYHAGRLISGGFGVGPQQATCVTCVRGDLRAFSSLTDPFCTPKSGL